MKHLFVMAEYTFAGYCSSGGANKDWAACLALEIDDQEDHLPEISEMTEVLYLSLHGPHGGNMIVEEPKKMTMKSARTHFANKCRQKEGRAYRSVRFASFLPSFGSPLGLPLTLFSDEEAQEKHEDLALMETMPALRYQASNVKAISSWEKLQEFVALDTYAISEKVNGERCLVVFEQGILRAYNRRGKLMSVPPVGATHLSKLGCPFVIDGERLTGDLAGYFVAFDLLEWNEEVLTNASYMKRIMTLEQAMYRAGLLVAHRPTPTFAEAKANSAVSNLALLIGVSNTAQAQKVITQVQMSSGEGLVVRHLSGSYTESPLKWKFVTDLDAFVIGINDGASEGSLKFGLFRATDQAVIEVANVRSGLLDHDIRLVRELLKGGERPVFTITYLPIRTGGIRLTEPRTSIALLRADKAAEECTSDQFGPEKAPFIAQAEPVDESMCKIKKD